MGLFRTPRFIRKFFRTRFDPIHPDHARYYKKGLSFFYMFIAWNLLGVLFFKLVKNKKIDTDGTESRWWQGKVYSLDNNPNNATVYRMKGLNVMKVPTSEETESDDV